MGAETEGVSGLTEGSPPTRGWTRAEGPRRRDPRGFPAHAGMDPRRARGCRSSRRVPRPRGDGPATTAPNAKVTLGSPPTRGWTRDHRRLDWPRRGFPAHAGMDPTPSTMALTTTWVPRPRGDGPATLRAIARQGPGSPPTRGWTPDVARRHTGRRGFPAHAGMDPPPAGGPAPCTRVPRPRGDGPTPCPNCAQMTLGSPPTRGWTRVDFILPGLDRGFPAHAGMDPPGQSSLLCPGWVPRPRGDGPTPCPNCGKMTLGSPPTRGWTRREARARDRVDGFPAHAGMDPSKTRCRPGSTWVPRPRGDGPCSARTTFRHRPGSPPTRGWTPCHRSPSGSLRGFPAHAGMDRTGGASASSRRRVPRPRGDGPGGQDGRRPRHPGSPPTRGWTEYLAGRPAPERGFPAHSGMDPVGVLRDR